MLHKQDAFSLLYIFANVVIASPIIIILTILSSVANYAKLKKRTCTEFEANPENS